MGERGAEDGLEVKKTWEAYPYQIGMVNFVLSQPKVALWAEMGLGKTVATLTALNELIFNRFLTRRVLVIAPKKVAEATWQLEAEKWEHLSKLRVSTALGTESQRLAAVYSDAHVCVINRDNVVWLVEMFCHDWPFDCVIVDESSSFKSHAAKRFKSLNAIHGKIERMVELTGTPAPNNYVDLWSQLCLLDQGSRLGRNISTFRDRYMRKLRHGGYEFVKGMEQEVIDRVQDICLSLKASDYLQLPDKVEVDFPVMLSEAAKKAYKAMQRESVLEVRRMSRPSLRVKFKASRAKYRELSRRPIASGRRKFMLTASTAAVLRMKLLQLSSGSCYNAEKDVVPVHTEKLNAFMELLETIGEPVLVFYAFQHEKDRIQAKMIEKKLKYRVYSGPDDQRAWNGRELDVLLAHPASCAYGLNLQQGGCTIVWFTLTDNLEYYLQANARLHRNGQDRPVRVFRLLCQGTVDEAVAASLAVKEGNQDFLLQKMRQIFDDVLEGELT